MSRPDLNPLAARLLGGEEYRTKLREQLLERAAETDDPAYAQRLREAADGKRPLRTLMHDPAFLASVGLRGPEAEKNLDGQLSDAEQPRGTPSEILEQWKEKARAAGVPIPTTEEARAVFDEVVALQERARRIVAEDRETGWGGSEERLGEKDEAKDKGDDSNQ
jgi:hypothetical protein